MSTPSMPNVKYTKVQRRYLYLGTALIIVIIVYLTIFVWPNAQAATIVVAKATAVANTQRSEGAKLYQARQRWQARTFNNYALHIQFGPPDNPDCEKIFEVNEPFQTKTVSDTCAGRYEPELLTFLGVGGSVSGLFSYIDNEINHIGECAGYNCACFGGRTINVIYDTDYGYPKSLEERYEGGWPTEAQRGPCPAMYFAPPRPFRVSLTPIQ